MGEFLSAWRLDLFVAVNLVLAGGIYLGAVRRVQRSARGPAHVLHGRWPVWTTACFLSGLGLIALTYLGPMGAWSHVFFWVHMTQHLVITMAVAPLLVLGAPITLAFRASSRPGRRAIVRVLRSTAVRILTNPYVTWVLFAGVLIGAHFTPFYDWALASHGLSTMVEQPLFLIAAFLYYLPLIGSNLLPSRPSHGLRLISLALMMIPEATIGAVIYFSPVVLYDGFDTVRPFGPTPLADQQFSGGLMWGLVMVIDSFWMMYVAAEWFTSEEKRGLRENARLDAELRSGMPTG
jgi:putative copper resistance protein D